MRENRRGVAIAVLILVLLAVTAGLVQAESLEGRTVIAPGEIHEGDLRAAGDTVVVDGTVTGDLMALAGNVTVPGTVEGDVLAAGGNLTLSGDVGDDVRAMGGTIIIDGTVSKNASLMGGNLQLRPQAELGGSVMMMGGQLESQAQVGRDLVVAGDIARIGGSVGGDLEARAVEVHILPDAEIQGDLIVSSETELILDEAATVEGEIIEEEPVAPSVSPDIQDLPDRLAPLAWMGRIIGFLGSLVVGAVLLALAPRPTVNTAGNLRRRPLESALYGLLALVAVPAVVVILLITAIGVPLGFLLLMYYGVMIFISRLFVGLWVGRLILKERAADFWALALGFLAISVLCAIPYLGWILNFLVVLGGLGALALTHVDLYRELREKHVTVEPEPEGPETEPGETPEPGAAEPVPGDEENPET